MALDKQKILSELGSVVNQLQSADCGCMGNLFSNSCQPSEQVMKNSMPMCGEYRHGCCHGHGCGHNYSYNAPCAAPCAGEPCPNASMNTNSNMNNPCVHFGNPRQVYADTCNYLNQNLMQPVVKEVYDDLKSLTPENTIANNPMASLMGLGNSMPQNNMGNTLQQNHMTSPGGNYGMPSIGNTSNQQEMQNLNMNTTNENVMGQSMGRMDGMGPNIMNMMMGKNGAKSNIRGHSGETLTGAVTSTSPQGQVGAASMSLPGQGQFSGGMRQSTPGMQMGNSTTHYNMTRSQAYGAVNQNPMAVGMAQMPHGAQQMGVNNSNRNASSGNYQQPGAHQMTAGVHNTYGAHSQGMRKFNEMFPGITQEMSGDLGFDPMAIAVQMNPANQKKVAMQTMQKLMTGNKFNDLVDTTLQQSAKTATGVTSSNLSQAAQPTSNQFSNNHVHQNNIVNKEAMQLVPQQIGTLPNNLLQQQQAYSAYDINPMKNQSHHLQGQPEQYQQYDPNTGTIEAQQSLPEQQLIKEPIFPVDTAKHSYYNTLGQPIEMLPAHLYHPPEPNLPQTLSPQDMSARLRAGQNAYQVKATVSKTAITGNRPVGRTPSRNQLHHIYNQYKGSQSYTQQNIKQPTQGATYSDGHLNIQQGNYNQVQRSPMERVGGDTAANLQVTNNQATEKVEQVTGQIGDVPVVKPGGDGGVPDKIPVTSQKKCRNGLQDMVYTSYPSSASWSFHGNNPVPFSAGYRFRNRTCRVGIGIYGIEESKNVSMDPHVELDCGF